MLFMYRCDNNQDVDDFQDWIIIAPGLEEAVNIFVTFMKLHVEDYYCSSLGDFARIHAAYHDNYKIALIGPVRSGVF